MDSNILFEDQLDHKTVLTGLARRCPSCRLIAHYEVKGRKEQEVSCPVCGFEFKVKKYRRGERPSSRRGEMKEEEAENE